MILIIDNFDSFVFNLSHYVQRLGVDTRVVRNNAISVTEIVATNPLAIIISPGPCTPKQAGVSIDVVKMLGPSIPILGVCLGHQAIGEAYGGETIRAKFPVHGKSSKIDHDGSDIFSNLPSPMEVGRYHSLIVALQANTPLKVTALNDYNEIMAMQHFFHPVYGVQFHPESVLTPFGFDIINNFICIAKNWANNKQKAKL